MIRALGVALMLSVLAGCSMWSAQRGEPALAERMEVRRLALQQWSFKGRVLSAEQRASLRWRQEHEQFDLLLRGPFGLGGLRISGTPDQVEINDGQQRWYSEQPAEDIYQRSGLLVPFQALPYWARGLPAPGPDSARLWRDQAGFIIRIEQAGWTIELDDYRATEQLWFPHHLRISAQGHWFEIEVTRWSWT